MGCVYKITCANTGRSYIGMTLGTAENRLKGHIRGTDGSSSRPLGKDIDKLGEENFQLEVLFESQVFSELRLKEIEMTLKFNTLTPNGYNLSLGTNGRMVRCLTNGILYPSTAEAERQTGVDQSYIKRVCYGQNIHLSKWGMWKFEHVK